MYTSADVATSCTHLAEDTRSCSRGPEVTRRACEWAATRSASSMGCCCAGRAADDDSELAQKDAIQVAVVQLGSATPAGSVVSNPLSSTKLAFASNSYGGSVTGLWPTAPRASAGVAASAADAEKQPSPKSPPKSKARAVPRMSISLPRSRQALTPRMSISLPLGARVASPPVPSPGRKRCKAGHALQPHTCTNANQDDMCDEFCAIKIGDRMYRCDQCAITLCAPCFESWPL